ncbi:hypothetical protein HY492_03450, partial [Candidatus Woesearchaeota archaeon]|nr:hypothetical protein [Candidatus Woesearchaeota archaeon]
LLMGCTAGQNQVDVPADDGITGTWRLYSEALYYDEGGGFLDNKATQTLKLAPSSWSFGDSEGTWTLQDITESDWMRWGIEPYGPTKKIVLHGWNEGEADGPIEESDRIDFLWVIYRVGPPIVEKPGSVWMKFGR